MGETALGQGARVYLDTDYVIRRDDLAVIPFNAVRWDTDNITEKLEDNGKLICQTPGIYFISAQAMWDRCMWDMVHQITIMLNDYWILATDRMPAIPGCRHPISGENYHWMFYCNCPNSSEPDNW